MHHGVIASQLRLAWILREQDHYTMNAGNQAAAKQTFDFQVMARQV